MKKLWQKGELNESELAKKVEQFTVGNDRDLDILLAKYDVLGSLGHTKMLAEVGLLTIEEVIPVQHELKNIYDEIETGNFSISAESEDIHSEVEFRLTKKLGDLGKKIHSGRSRNDQVLLDIKLFTRSEIEEIVSLIKKVFDTLIQLSDQHTIGNARQFWFVVRGLCGKPDG